MLPVGDPAEGGKHHGVVFAPGRGERNEVRMLRVLAGCPRSSQGPPALTTGEMRSHGRSRRAWRFPTVAHVFPSCRHLGPARTSWVSPHQGPNVNLVEPRRGDALSEIPPGKLAGLKGHLQILEISGPANELETQLFVAAVQKHRRALVVLAVEIVGNDNEECFFLRDQERIFLLRYEGDIRTATRRRGEHFRRQLFYRLIIKDRWLVKTNPYDRPLRLRLPGGTECELGGTAGVLPTPRRRIGDLFATSIRKSEELDLYSIRFVWGNPRRQLQLGLHGNDEKRPA